MSKYRDVITLCNQDDAYHFALGQRHVYCMNASGQLTRVGRLRLFWRWLLRLFGRRRGLTVVDINVATGTITLSSRKPR